MKASALRTITALGMGMVTLALPSASRGQGEQGLPRPASEEGAPAAGLVKAADPGDPDTAAKKELLLKWMDSTLGPRLGMDAPRREWQFKQVMRDEIGMWHFKLHQVYGGIAVKGGALSVHLADPVDGREAVQPQWLGQYQDNPQVNVTPVITAQSAIQAAQREAVRQVRAALAEHGGAAESKLSPDPLLKVKEPARPNTASLEVHPGGGPGRRQLSFHVVIHAESGPEPMQLHAWIGAQASNQGRVLLAYNNIQKDTGYSLYQGTLNIGAAYWPAANQRVLNDNYYRFGCYDMYGSTSATYQASNGLSTYWGNYSTSNRQSSNADVHWGTIQAFSFMYYKLGRNGPDGAGGPRYYGSVDGQGTLVTSRNHYGVNYVNAFWDGVKTNFGDGDGSTSGPLTCLDIVAHEWGHALTQGVAGPTDYINESGAINESFSDIYGSMAERYWKGESANTWKMGEQCWTPATGGDALRYMNRPTIDGYSRDYFPERLTGSSDNGGVHGNSGIMNNAFYLLAAGGYHRRGTYVYGIGADKATRIFYEAELYYLVRNSGFSAARQATLYRAGSLYGYSSQEYLSTARAWLAVGVS